MKKLSPLVALLLCSITCGPDPELAKADRPHEAQKFGMSALSPEAQRAAAVWQRSYSAENSGNFQEALDALAQLPEAARGGYTASYRRGWLLYRLGHYAESAAAYNTAAGMQPASVEARVAQLVPLMAQSKWDDVIAAAQDVLRRDPQNYLALQRLAFAKFSTQHFPEAESLYRHLVELYPSDIEMRAGLGWAALRMGKQKEASELFSEVLEISPTHASAARGLLEATAHKHHKR